MAVGRRATPVETRQDHWFAIRDRWKTAHGIKDGPALKHLCRYVQAAQVGNSSPYAGRDGGGRILYALPPGDPGFTLVVIGKFMEETTQILHATMAEAREAKTTLEMLKNEIGGLSEVIQPALMAHADQIRAHRMTVVSELNQALTAMKEVRKFFLDRDYATEMERLERFIRLCRDLQSLKQSGILDAVSDLAIRLAVREESQP